MRRLGVDVWPLNTVHFSNHTQYAEGWTGSPMPPDSIGEVVRGLNGVGQLSRCDAVLSGYIGSAAQGAHILDAVRAIKAANPRAVYVLDPVMGHPEKGCIVADGVAEFLAGDAVHLADVICPNVLELETISGCEGRLGSVEECVRAARGVIGRDGGACKTVLVKHLAYAGEDPSGSFEMLLVTAEEAWHVAVPLLEFERAPVGVGDLTTAMQVAPLTAIRY